MLQKIYEDMKSTLLHGSVQERLTLGALLVAPIFLAAFMFQAGGYTANDIRASSVMITNFSGSRGGTGIILTSTNAESRVLTNAHVCGIVKTGAIVKATTGEYQIKSYKQSTFSDLCLITVTSDLGVNTAIADRAPSFYEEGIISGHPGLLPNVITTGHFSGRRIIPVTVGIHKCTPEEGDPSCMFFGTRPEVRLFEAVLVTATIMPGSSGSGVYTKDQKLAGVVFAGQASLGYAWTVPYEQMVTFLRKEAPSIIEELSPTDYFKVNGATQEDMLESVSDKCREAKLPEHRKLCSLLKLDLMYRE